MYEIFGLKRLLRGFAALCGLIALALWARFDAALSVIGFARYLSAAVTIGLLVIWAAGETKVFPWLCRLPLLNLLLPDIDGRWQGTLRSNWSRVQQRSADPSLPPADLLAVPVEVTITARLFFVHVELVSVSDYTRSRTLAVRPTRDPESGRLRLSYIFESTTKTPVHGDSAVHQGAAYLEFHDEREAPRLDGLYWTNRNWGQALNTAGTITLHRNKSS